MKFILLSVLLTLAGSIYSVNGQSITDKDCASQHRGDFSFSNITRDTLQLKVLYCYMPEGSQYPGYKTSTINFALKPNETKLINGVMISPGVRNNFVAKAGNTVVDEGDFITRECETVNYKINNQRSSK